MRRVIATLLAFLLADNASANPLASALASQAPVPIISDPAASNESEASGEPSAEGDIDASDLSQLGARLAAIALSYEAVRDPAHLDSSVKRLVEFTAPHGLIADPADRGRTLDRVYRALALIDDTHALRYPEGEKCARAHRLALLRSPDGLFSDPKTGELSPWLKAEFKRSRANAAPAGLIAASARKWTALGYLQTLADVRRVSLDLADRKILGAPRVAAFCRRANLFGDLAAAQDRFTWNDPDLTAQAKSVVEVRFGKEKGTGTVLLFDGATIVLVSSRFTENAYEAPDLYAKSGRRLPATYVRRGSILSILSIQPSPDVEPLAITENPVEGVGIAYALGNPVQGGPWSLTRGLARPEGRLILADAAIDGGQAGGPLFDTRGRLLGVLAGEGSAYGLAAIVNWLKDENAGLPEVPIGQDSGTGSLLTTSPAVPTETSGLIESAMVCKDVRGCTLPSESPSGGFDYSAPYTGPNLWSMLGKLFSSKPKPAPPVVEVPRFDSPAVLVEAPKPPPEPPKPECSFASIDPPKSVGTDPVELRVQFTCTYPDGAKEIDLSGHDVVFSVGWKGDKVITRTVPTDAQGIASVPLIVQSTERSSEKAHDDLDEYERSLRRPASPPPAPAPFIGVSLGSGLISTGNPGGPPQDEVKISSNAPDGGQAASAAAIILVRTPGVSAVLIEGGATITLGALASTIVMVGAVTASFTVGWKIGKFAMSIKKEMRESLDTNNEAIDSRNPMQAKFDDLARESVNVQEDEKDCWRISGGEIMTRFVDRTRLTVGFLRRHEKNGGHTIERHVEKPLKYLIGRLNEVRDASSYTDLLTAENVIRRTVASNRFGIES